jgi:hypothetical protein
LAGEEIFLCGNIRLKALKIDQELQFAALYRAFLRGSLAFQFAAAFSSDIMNDFAL